MRAKTGNWSRARPTGPASGELFAPPAAVAPLPPPAAVAPRQLWLALRLTTLPLIAAAPERSAASGVPLVVVAGEGARREIIARNAAAGRAGIEAGLALGLACALAPTLEVRGRASVEEARRLEWLGRWAGGFTPCVSLEPPDQLLLEVQGSLKLFGGAAALSAGALTALAAEGYAAVAALAPTPRAAIWLARAAPGSCIESPARLAGALHGLALSCTGWPARTLEDCARLGVTTLGGLRRLPRDGLAQRFEKHVLRELDEAFGQRPAVRRRLERRERFRERLELPVEFEDLAQLGPGCELLLARLEQFLRRRAAGVTRLAFSFLHRDFKPSGVRLGRALPAAAAAEWRGLLRERLRSVVLPAPVTALVLRTCAAVPLPGSSATLPGIEAARSTAAWALLDRLRARLGEAAVQGVSLVPEHRPERAFRALSPQPAAAPLQASPSAARLPPAPRPLWLLAAPAALEVRAGRPCHDGCLRLESGPERIESGWWDGQEVARDYYVAVTPAGQRLWIYRERAGQRWALHGVFG